MVTRPLGLTDHQMALLRNAAAAVPVRHREAFLQGVTRHLTDEPTDTAVQAAINAALDRVPIYFTDGQPKEKTP